MRIIGWMGTVFASYCLTLNQRITLGSSSGTPPTFHDSVFRLVNESQGSCCLYLPNTGINLHTSCPAFLYGSENWIQVLFLERQALHWLSYCPASSLSPFRKKMHLESNMSHYLWIVLTTMRANLNKAVIAHKERRESHKRCLLKVLLHA